MSETIVQGTSKCDICGQNTPHGHDEELVETERFTRPAFERTAVPMGSFGFARLSRGLPYSFGRTEALWQHFIAGWFASKKHQRILNESRFAGQLATWMMTQSFATGHGDSVEDLLKELDWQVTELRKKVRP